MMERIKALYRQYREVLFYLIFGGLTTLVNYVTYFVMTRAWSLDEIFSNVIAWLLSVIFAYITNKIWVFNAKTHTFKEFLREITMFFSARVFSGVLDTVILLIFFTWLGISDVIVKIASGILVIILNYFFSKFIIFKKKSAAK